MRFDHISYEVIFSNKTDQRNWVKKADIYAAIDILRMIGYDPFLFNLDDNSQHILLTIGWLIWRCDLFRTVYAQYMPDDDIQYLPPYDDYLTDPTITEPPPKRKPPRSWRS